MSTFIATVTCDSKLLVTHDYHAPILSSHQPWVNSYIRVVSGLVISKTLKFYNKAPQIEHIMKDMTPQVNIIFIVVKPRVIATHYFTLNIFYCQAVIQTMDQTQVINLRGLLRYIVKPVLCDLPRKH